MRKVQMTVQLCMLHLCLVLIIIPDNSISLANSHSDLGCQLHSCIHGICKPLNNGSYECFCENGYTGYNCETNYNDCVSTPCQNGATCIDEVAYVICICSTGYTGHMCDSILNHCTSQPCLNGGACIDLEDNYQCNCTPGFSGRSCEVDIDVCNSTDQQDAHCYNGGTCIEGTGASFTCSCPSGFEGPRCETDIDECQSQPCLNNGTCVDVSDGFICICPYRWSGITCETEQEICSSELCSNQGLCLGNETYHICYCIPDYHGLKCQWKYDECLPEPSCMNGGICIDGVDSFTCICPPSYTGKRCEARCMPSNCTMVTEWISSISITDNEELTITTAPTLDSLSITTIMTSFLQSGSYDSAQSNFNDAESMQSSMIFQDDSASIILNTWSLETESQAWNSLQDSSELITQFEEMATLTEHFLYYASTSQQGAKDDPDNFSHVNNIDIITPTVSMQLIPSSSMQHLSSFQSEFYSTDLSESDSHILDISSTIFQPELSTYSLHYFITDDPFENTSQIFEVLPSSCIDASDTSNSLPIFHYSKSLETPILQSVLNEFPPINDDDDDSESLTNSWWSPLFSSTDVTETDQSFSSNIQKNYHASDTLQSFVTNIININADPAISSNGFVSYNTLVDTSSFENNVYNTDELSNYLHYDDIDFYTSYLDFYTTLLMATSDFRSQNSFIGSEEEDYSRIISEYSSFFESGSWIESTLEQWKTKDIILKFSSTTQMLSFLGSSVIPNSLVLTLSSSSDFNYLVSTETVSISTLALSSHIRSNFNTEDDICSASSLNGFEDIYSRTQSFSSIINVQTMEIDLLPTSFFKHSNTLIIAPNSTIHFQTLSSLVPTDPFPVHSQLPAIFGSNCSDHICKNGGICQQLSVPVASMTFMCLCRLHFSGPLCEDSLLEITLPSFNGYSLLSYLLYGILNATDNVEIRITFTTMTENGILLYLDFADENSCQGAFLMVEIHNGLLISSFSCGSPSTLGMEEGLRVDDGYHHAVKIGIQWYQNYDHGLRCNVSMQLDHWPPLTGQQHDLKSFCDISFIHIGGLKQTFSMSTVDEQFKVKQGFKGCVMDVQINDHPLNMITDASDGLGIQECTDVLCTVNTCYNGGICERISDVESKCECPVDITGEFCERLRCPEDYCSFGSTCLPMAAATSDVDDINYICLCSYGLRGQRCDEAVTIQKYFFYGSVMGYSSFVAFSLPHVIWQEFEVHLQFVTDNVFRSGLMVFIGKNGTNVWNAKFLAVGLHESSIFIQYNSGFGYKLLKSDYVLQGAGDINTLVTGANTSHIWIHVNKHVNVYQHQLQITELSLGSYLNLGGHQSYNFTSLPEALLFHEGYKGCIYDVNLHIDGNKWSQAELPTFGRNVGQCEMNQCTPNPCENGGTCASDKGTFICYCPPEWYGLLCTQSHSPCLNGSHHCSPSSVCVEEDQSYKCHCPLGWSGEYCDKAINISTPYFNGRNAFMSFLPQNIRHEMVIQLHFLSTSIDGILFYVGNPPQNDISDFALVALVNGYVEFYYNLGGGRFSTSILRSETRVLVNNWHKAEIWLKGKWAQLNLDDQRASSVAPSGMVTLDTTTDFYLGSVPEQENVTLRISRISVPFQGCIYHFAVNEVTYIPNIQGSAKGDNIQQCNSTFCIHNICANGGTCIFLGKSSYHCICPNPFTGKNCLEVLPCYLHTCQNGGTCVPKESEDSKLQFEIAYDCDCPMGWSGQFCEIVIKVTEAHFRGDSYVLLVDESYAISDRTRNRIAFNFSTSQKHGVILWTGEERSFDDDFFGIGLDNGQLKIVWNLGWFSRSNLKTSLTQSLLDSEWHEVLIYREKQKISVSVDGFHITGYTPGSFTELNTLGFYYLGGFPRGNNISIWTNGLFSSSFIGCLKDVQIAESKTAMDFMEAESSSNIHQC